LLADGAVDGALVRLALPATEGDAQSVGAAQSGPLANRTDAFEREQILAELKRNHQRMTDTAKALGLERSHLYKKCQALGIDLRAMRGGG
jgi:two-component system nitrogen regulation response regulator NtrX